MLNPQFFALLEYDVLNKILSEPINLQTYAIFNVIFACLIALIKFLGPSFLRFSFRFLNPPVAIHKVIFSTIKLKSIKVFEGLNKVYNTLNKSTSTVESIFYSIYKVVRKAGLDNYSDGRILFSSSYSLGDKKAYNLVIPKIKAECYNTSKSFWPKSSHNVHFKNLFDLNGCELDYEDLDLLFETFELACGPDVTGQDLYLLNMCIGGIAGAKYSNDVYNQILVAAFNATIGNKEIVTVNMEEKLFLFITFVGFFVNKSNRLFVDSEIEAKFSREFLDSISGYIDKLSSILQTLVGVINN